MNNISWWKNYLDIYVINWKYVLKLFWTIYIYSRVIHVLLRTSQILGTTYSLKKMLHLVRLIWFCIVQLTGVLCVMVTLFIQVRIQEFFPTLSKKFQPAWTLISPRLVLKYLKKIVFPNSQNLQGFPINLPLQRIWPVCASHRTFGPM
jgi:hypothetical protein